MFSSPFVASQGAQKDRDAMSNQKRYQQYDPTGDYGHRKMVQVEGKRCIIYTLPCNFYDNYRSLRNWWFNTSHCFMLVYSVASRPTFNVIKQLCDEIKRAREIEESIPIGTAVPIVLVGQKSDVGEEIREVTEKDGLDLSKELVCAFHEASAKTGTNVEDLFLDVARDYYHRKSKESPEPSKETSGDMQNGPRKWYHRFKLRDRRCIIM